MDTAIHAQFFAQGLDPVVWMRMFRVFMFLVAGVLMLMEPMQCGGKNSTLHRILATGFFIWSYYSYDIAKARMGLIATGNFPLDRFDLLISEIALTLFSVSLVVKLGYDAVQWHEYRRLNTEKQRCNHECKKSIEI